MTEGPGSGPDGLMLFDGECRFCSASVDLALALDRAGRLRFTPVQSPYGRRLAAEHGLDPDDPTTFVYFEAGRPRMRSDGVLALAVRLGWPGLPVRLLGALPRSWRDGLYDLIARYRFRLLGRRTVCRAPRPGEAERFILEPPAGASGPERLKDRP